MRDLLEPLRRWQGEGSPIAVATVVGVRGSAPRGPGASMAVNAAGEVAGSVSGGCVEAAVYTAARAVLDTGQPGLERFGYSDDEAFAVGLTCGGELEIAVAPFTGPAAELLLAALAAAEPVALATCIAGPGTGARLAVTPARAAGSLGPAHLDAAVASDARGLLALGRQARRHYGAQGQRRGLDVEVFVDSFAPAPRMLVFGAVDFAAAVARLGSFLGYRVTVCDARATFATPARFPDAAEVVVAWPHDYLAETTVDARTVICVLTHEPKFDVPLLAVALRTPAAYVGALGSRRTHLERLRRLRAAGLTEAELARLASPIGLDLGGRTPEETAVSIAAEIIARHWAGTGLPLSQTAGPVHRADGAPGPGSRPTSGPTAGRPTGSIAEELSGRAAGGAPSPGAAAGRSRTRLAVGQRTAGNAG